MKLIINDMKTWQTKLGEELVHMELQKVTLDENIELTRKRQTQVAEALEVLAPTKTPSVKT